MPGLLQTQTDACLAPARWHLVSVEQALAIGLAEAQPIAETELIDLSTVTGRILAQPIKADAPLPRFDYSAMDGYAIDTSSKRSKSLDTSKSPRRCHGATCLSSVTTKSIHKQSAC